MRVGGTRVPGTVYENIFVRYFDKGQRKPLGLFSVNTHPNMQPLRPEKHVASLNNTALQSEDPARALTSCPFARLHNTIEYPPKFAEVEGRSKQVAC